MPYLIDTDWLIDALEDRGAARDVLEALYDQGLAVSLVSLGELYLGLVEEPDEAQELARLRRFVVRFEQIGLTDEVMVIYARNKRELDQRGTPLPDFDLLIAATAIETDRALITRNHRHFDRVPGLRIY
jgi:tRNA(fMet)-specific endonuclease VapC